MSIRRLGIKSCLAGGFLALSVILLTFSLSTSKLPVNTAREAAKVSRTAGIRMHILEK